MRVGKTQFYERGIRHPKEVRHVVLLRTTLPLLLSLGTPPLRGPGFHPQRLGIAHSKFLSQSSAKSELR